MMRVLDLFSGIGGFSLGLERAGMRTVAFCEIDPFCRKVLRKHWPGVPIFEDVRKLDAARLGRIDVITGGYPCQPFSLAGQRKGDEDDRHLWPAMFAIVQQARPAWVIGENVAGHISMGLDQVLSDLETEGYACRTFVIPACAVDAPHRRDRIWIVAHARRQRCDGRGVECGGSETAGPRHRASRPSKHAVDVADADARQRSGANSEVCARRDATDNGGKSKPMANPKLSESERQQQHSGEILPEQKAVRFSGGSASVADTDRKGLSVEHGTRYCGQAPERKLSRRELERANPESGAQQWLPEPNVGRVAARVSLGLDDIGGRLDEYAAALARAKGISESDAHIVGLRALRRYGEIAETSSELQKHSCDDPLQDVSRQITHRRKAGETYEEMRDLWNSVSTQSLEEAQDMFKEVLVRNWKTQCDEALGQRVNRLRALGNAVVPQIPEIIGRVILSESVNNASV